MESELNGKINLENTNKLMVDLVYPINRGFRIVVKNGLNQEDITDKIIDKINEVNNKNAE